MNFEVEISKYSVAAKWKQHWLLTGESKDEKYIL